MVTPKQVQASMTPEKLKADRRDPFVYIFRVISYYVAAPLISLHVTATQVTIMSIVPALAAFFVIALSQTVGMRVVGGLLWALWGLLDCVDGNIARYCHMQSARGELWDATGGYVALCTWPLAAGMAAYFDNANSLVALPIEPVIYVFLGGIASIAVLFPRLLMHKAFHENSKGKEGFTKKVDFSIPKRIALMLLTPVGLSIFLYIISCFIHTLNLLIIVYSFLFVVVCLVSCRKVFKDF